MDFYFSERNWVFATNFDFLIPIFFAAQDVRPKGFDISNCNLLDQII